MADPNPNPKDGDNGENPEPTPTPTPKDDFKEIKEKFQSELKNKDDKIQELEDKIKKQEEEHKKILKDLNDEVDNKLKQSEEYKEILKKVETLEKDRAEATVDAYIQKGIILPVQRETAVKLCLSDNDTFMDLYKDAKPIVEVGGQKSKPVSSELAGQLTSYIQ